MSNIDTFLLDSKRHALQNPQRFAKRIAFRGAEKSIFDRNFDPQQQSCRSS